MPGMIIGTKFTVPKDDVSKAFGKMTRSSDKFGRSASKTFKTASKGASRFGDIVKGVFVAGVLQRGISALTGGISAAGREFIDFDRAMMGAAARFSDVNLLTKEGQKLFQKLKRTAREVGATTMFTATESAKGLDFYARASFTAAQAMVALRGTTKLAEAAGLDLATASDIASDALGSFGLMTKNTAQLQKNFTRLNDVMIKTSNSTNVTLEGLFESVKKGAPAFTVAGQSLESFNAILAPMAAGGIKGEEAGTQLRNMMIRLSSPTKAAQSVLTDLGVTVQDQAGNFLDILDILEDFEGGLKKLGTQEKATAIATVFGARAFSGLGLIMDNGISSIRAFREELFKAEGTTKRIANIIGTALFAKLKALQSVAIETAFKFFTAFEKDMGPAIDNFTTRIRGIDVKPLIEATKAIIGLVSVVSAVVQVLASMAKPFVDIIGTAAKFYGGFLTPELPAPPNQAEVQRQQQVGVNGTINIAGAPAGTTAEMETTGPGIIGLELLGANP